MLTLIRDGLAINKAQINSIVVEKTPKKDTQDFCHYRVVANMVNKTWCTLEWFETQETAEAWLKKFVDS